MLNRSFRFSLVPIIALAVTLFALWYTHLPAPTVTSNMAQVEKEANSGDYLLMDVDTLWRLYQTELEKILLVDTRQEWEHRAGHIAKSINFPMEPGWWTRWRKKSELEAFLGPHKEKTIVFY